MSEQLKAEIRKARRGRVGFTIATIVVFMVCLACVVGGGFNAFFRHYVLAGLFLAIGGGAITFFIGRFLFSVAKDEAKRVKDLEANLRSEVSR